MEMLTLLLSEKFPFICHLVSVQVFYRYTVAGKLCYLSIKIQTHSHG